MGRYSPSGLLRRAYNPDSPGISTLTDRRNLLIGGAPPQLPGSVVIADKRLADAEQFGTPAEIASARRHLIERLDAAIEATIAERGRLAGATEPWDLNARAFLTRREASLRTHRGQLSGEQ